MSREEAIDYLKRIEENYDCCYEEDALEMAIKALKQEPCEDAISRRAALDIIDRYSESQSNVYDVTQDCLSDVIALPPVKPQEPTKVGHWEWVQYDGNPNIGNWHCSECRTIIPFMPEETDDTPIYKWCPMCGARMGEVKE